MTPFSTNNPLVKTVVFIANTFGQRPSSIFGELFKVQFSPEEALVIDSESLTVMAEQARISSGNYETEAERLKSKWAAQDAQTRREISKQQKQIGKRKYSKPKSFRR